ncbi:protein lethal(2)essential for life-like [Diaphorina citri]|uniref:Protein lethal(2)essential for life-like n=1 Tax=Diaphorina citri TaxID=121845 RepID=A0A1S3DSB7_DIACI|nr:protein lethal(2)essential for life-like [Diaphorina citri]
MGLKGRKGRPASKNWSSLATIRHLRSAMDAGYSDPMAFISIKTVDGFILVEGKHEEKEDEHGFISRQFKRRYLLPKDVEIEKVTSSLSSDGVLTITAPKRTLQDKTTERPVPIVQTGVPALKPQAPSSNSSTQQSQPIITSPTPSVCGDPPRETNIKIEQH